MSLKIYDDIEMVVAESAFETLENHMFMAAGGTHWVDNNQDIVEMYRFFLLTRAGTAGLEVVPFYGPQMVVPSGAVEVGCIGFWALTDYADMLKKIGDPIAIRWERGGD